MLSRKRQAGRAITQIQVRADVKRADADQSIEQEVTADAIGKVSRCHYRADDCSSSRPGNHVLCISGKAVLLFTGVESCFLL